MITKYPDGSFYTTVPLPAINSNEQDYDRVFRINSYNDLWALNQYVDAVNSFGVIPHITIPCLLDAQADERESPGTSFGLQLVLDFLNSMNATFTVFHPHNPQVVKMHLEGAEVVDNYIFIKEVFNHLSAVESPEKWGKLLSSYTTLMAVDAGGYKPLAKLCDKLQWDGELYSASKSRAYVDGKSTTTHVVDKLDFGGKDVLIVDDICIYGNTFKNIAKILRERNVGKLNLAVSHMTVEDLAGDPVTNYFDRVFTTNSKYEEYFSNIYSDKPKNLTVVKLFA